MLTTFTHQFSPPSSSMVHAFEQKWAISLPADYRNWLILTGGGRPKENCFPIDGDRGNPGCVQFLFGLRCQTPTYDLDIHRDQWICKLRKDYLVIGCTGTNDWICIELNSTCVSYLDVGAWWGCEFINIDKMDFISSNFSDFLLMLEPLDCF